MTIEIGLSDFHKLSLTVMKVFYRKQKSNIIKYRSYQNFDNEAFISNLRVAFSEICNENELLSFQTFKNIVDHTLETHASLKKRCVRANQAPFINRKINKKTMKRNQLRNKFLNSKNDLDRRAYNKQRNICVSLMTQEEISFFSNLKTKDVNDNKTFWKTVNLFLQIKCKSNLK